MILSEVVVTPSDVLRVVSCKGSSYTITKINHFLLSLSATIVPLFLQFTLRECCYVWSLRMYTHFTVSLLLYLRITYQSLIVTGKNKISSKLVRHLSYHAHALHSLSYSYTQSLVNSNCIGSLLYIVQFSSLYC